MLWRDNLMWPEGGARLGVAATPGIAVADPRLTRGDGLLRIGPGSPAIDGAGSGLAWVTVDLDGQAREAPDIGADEYAPGPVRVSPLGPRDVGPDAFEERPDIVAKRLPAIPTSPMFHPGTPNPFRGSARVEFWVQAAGPVELAVYDVSGRRVAVLTDGPLTAGRHSAEWRPAGVAPGVYYVRLRAGALVATRPLTYLR